MTRGRANKQDGKTHTQRNSQLNLLMSEDCEEIVDI